jgi:hypothetical protein
VRVIACLAQRTRHSMPFAYAPSNPALMAFRASGRLRDHARVLLLAVVVDMQSTQAKHDKSRGDLPNNSPKVTETAQAHAQHRARGNRSTRRRRIDVSARAMKRF